MSVLTAVARADAEVTGLILELDARGQPLVLPALAMAAAALDARSEDADDALRGLERLDSVEVAPLRDAEQAARLAAVIARTGLDPWDAHVAAVADAAVCPILTLDAAKWRQHAGDLDEPLHTIEIADPEAPGTSSGVAPHSRTPHPATSTRTSAAQVHAGPQVCTARRTAGTQPPAAASEAILRWH